MFWDPKLQFANLVECLRLDGAGLDSTCPLPWPDIVMGMDAALLGREIKPVWYKTVEDDTARQELNMLWE